MIDDSIYEKETPMDDQVEDDHCQIMSFDELQHNAREDGAIKFGRLTRVGNNHRSSNRASQRIAVDSILDPQDNPLAKSHQNFGDYDTPKNNEEERKQ